MTWRAKSCTVTTSSSDPSTQLSIRVLEALLDVWLRLALLRRDGGTLQPKQRAQPTPCRAGGRARGAGLRRYPCSAAPLCALSELKGFCLLLDTCTDSSGSMRGGGGK